MSKRSETGRKKGKRWKAKGHAEEALFNARFNRAEKLNMSGASADCRVDDETAAELVSLNVQGREVSLKAGRTAQFHLGDIPQLSDKSYYHGTLRQVMVGGRVQTHGSHRQSWSQQVAVLSSEEFWSEYLGKGDYYVQKLPGGKQYVFFAMKDVVKFVASRTIWRLLETGRIKGDLPVRNSTGVESSRAVLTFEYRESHGSFALGAISGSNAHLFARILQQNIPSVVLQSDF